MLAFVERFWALRKREYSKRQFPVKSLHSFAQGALSGSLKKSLKLRLPVCKALNFSSESSCQFLKNWQHGGRSR